MAVRAVLFDLDGTLWHPVGYDQPGRADRHAEIRARRVAPELGVEAGPGLASLVAGFWTEYEAGHAAADAGLANRDGPAWLRRFLSERGHVLEPEPSRRAWEAMRIPAAEYPFRLFPDTLSTLSRLNEMGLATALVTNNYPARLLKPDLDEYGIRPSVFIASSDVGYRKPHRLIFSRALQSLGMGPADVIMVGDSFENDVLGARAMGITAVLKLNGRAPTPEERDGSDHLIDNLADLFGLGLF